MGIGRYNPSYTGTEASLLNALLSESRKSNKAAPSSFALQLSQGKIPGLEAIRKFGNNAAVGGSIEDIWPNGGLYPFPTTAETLRIRSGGNAADNGLFVGILTLTDIITDTEACTIGAKTYTFQDTLTNVDGNIAIAGTKASESLTYTGQPANNEVVVIGGDTYTFQTSLTNVDKNVFIGANQEASLDNLIAAINLAAGAGTTYAAATTAGESVATKTSSTVMLATAKVQGAAGGITSTTDITNASWANATLQGGADNTEGTLDNLVDAIDLSGVAGTDYAVLMTAHPNNGTPEFLVATDGAGLTVGITADAAALVTTETFNDGSWSSATLLGGVGAQTVTVEFLDSNWDVQTETLVLRGAVASDPTTLTARRVLRAWVDQTGTYTNENTGIIIVENSSANQILATIAATAGESQLSMYTVPNNKTAYLVNFNVSSTDGVAVTADMLQRQNADDIVTPFKSTRVVTSTLSSSTGHFEPALSTLVSFPERTDIWWRAVSGSSSNVAVNYELILVDNK